MSTFHATSPGIASNPSTWAEHAVPGATDDWEIAVDLHIDSGLPTVYYPTLATYAVSLDSGGVINNGHDCTLNADVFLVVNSGATVNAGWLDVRGVLFVNGGTLINAGGFLQSTDTTNAVLAAFNNALLVNPTNFGFGRWFPQTMDDGGGGPTTVRLQYTSTPPVIGSANYLPPTTIIATVANGATIDFATRNSSGVVSDPDFLPSVPVIQHGAVTDTIITLRRNGPGSYTATFSTPTGDDSYYVPVQWTVGGDTYIQEFHVAVLNPDLPGKVLGGGASALVGDGVQVTSAGVAASAAEWGGVPQKLLVAGLTGAGSHNGLYSVDPSVWTASGYSGPQFPSWGNTGVYGIVSDGTYWYLFTNSFGGSPVWRSSAIRVGSYIRPPWDATLVWTQTLGSGNGTPVITRADCDGVSIDRVMRAVLALAAGKTTVSTSGGDTTVTFLAQDGVTTAFTVTFAAATGQRNSTSIGA